MKRNLLIFFGCFLILFLQDKNLEKYNKKTVEIPIIKNSYFEKYNLVDYGEPTEDRSDKYLKYLSVSVKILVNNGSGSGTIVYYDDVENKAYVASCGHLWAGNKDYNKNDKIKCKVVTWYNNEEKIDNTKSYTGDVLFWSNIRGYDSSLVCFSPDWKPNFYPIAPTDYEISPGKILNSLGCDQGKEVARYETEVIGYVGENLLVKKNTPRPGRSGGGLLDENGYYLATCVATSDVTGKTGVGYFTSLKSIHYIYGRNGFGWLLKTKPTIADKIEGADEKINFPNKGIRIFD